MEIAPKKTPFYPKHIALGARIVPFAGFLMPIQYTGIIAEHLTVRNAVGVFDVTHMGEFIIRGTRAEEYLNKLTINDITKLTIGQVQYSAMCYPDGGIVDDLLIYRLKDDEFMMVVNASNIEKDFNWINQFIDKDNESYKKWYHTDDGIPYKNINPYDSDTVQIENKSDTFALLAIQGPNSLVVLQQLTEVDLQSIPYYHFTTGRLAGVELLISRTGYTGELGFELYHQPAQSLQLWDAIFQVGRDFGIQPVGLGARDTLRLEMKYCLYGNDIDQTTNPLEAGLGWITKLAKNDFIGKTALLKIKEQGVIRKLIAFEMIERAIPRHGCAIWINNQNVGMVTSGTQSPSLNKGIGLGYLASQYTSIGTEIFIDIRGKKTGARVIKPPFVPSHTL